MRRHQGGLIDFRNLRSSSATQALERLVLVTRLGPKSELEKSCYSWIASRQLVGGRGFLEDRLFILIRTGYFT